MCDLYYQYGRTHFKLGSFRNQKKAEEFWHAIKEPLRDKLGLGIKPIYVETGKGRGKK